ncbi:MAG TPA: recombinase family protein [Ferruginibacter sp.]|nr:recombinase family protein [Ferruginibacter sp.]
MKTAAIYTRVSCDQQKQNNTIESQVEALLSFAAENECVVSEEHIFKDEGYSGAVLVRPGLERIRDLSAEGNINTVLIYSPDRLSRNYAYQIVLLDEFASHGTEVLFVNSPKAETPEEALLLQFQGMIAEYERALIKERSRRGKRFKAKAGIVNVLTRAPYGYKYVRKTPEGIAYYQILEEEASVVKEIFKLYTEEFLSLRAIANQLSARKIATKKGSLHWERTSIWNILSNTAYIGKAYFGKWERTERKRTTKGLRAKGGISAKNHCKKKRPMDQWIEIAVPSIISNEPFELAQERLKNNKLQSERNTVEISLLQGFLVCSQCGYSLHRTSYQSAKGKVYYYRCGGSNGSKHPNGRKCNCRPVRQDYLDRIVWQSVSELLKNPLLIQQEIDKRIQQTKSSNASINQKELLEKQKAKLLQAIDKLLDAYQEGLIEINDLRKRMPELQKRCSITNKELDHLKAQQIGLDNRLELLDVNKFTQQLNKNIDQLDLAEKRKIIKLLIKEILVGTDNINIKHSIPVKEAQNPEWKKNYELCPARK